MSRLAARVAIFISIAFLISCFQLAPLEAQSSDVQCPSYLIQCPLGNGCVIGGSAGRFQPSRISPVDGKIRNHTGIDLIATDGTPVLAAATGTVSSAEFNTGGYGNIVTIEHSIPRANGSEKKYGNTKYGHLKSFIVRAGQRVQTGEVIGFADSTGRSTGSHLHFEFRTSQGSATKLTDPLPCIATDNRFIARKVQTFEFFDLGIVNRNTPTIAVEIYQNGKLIGTTKFGEKSTLIDGFDTAGKPMNIAVKVVKTAELGGFFYILVDGDYVSRFGSKNPFYYSPTGFSQAGAAFVGKTYYFELVK